MSDDTRPIVNLSAPLDLMAFPSEEETTALPAADTPQVSTRADASVEPQIDEAESPAPQPQVFAPAAMATVRPIAAVENVAPAADTQSSDAAAQTPPVVVPHRPATVTEFPTQIARSTAPEPLVVASPLTLMDVLDRQGGLDWRQAVSVVHQICEQLRGQNPHSPMLLEARNILINHRGEVRLLPGQPGGDPLVIQLGRLLRSMLRGSDAPPPELRLLLAQATFELPIFESVEDVDRALRQLDTLEEASGRQVPFASPVSLPPPIPAERPVPRPSPRSILPAQPVRMPKEQMRRRGEALTQGLPIAAIVVGLAILAAFVISRIDRRLQPASAAVNTTPSVVVPPALPATDQVEVATTSAPAPAASLEHSPAPASTARPLARSGQSAPRGIAPQPHLPPSSPGAAAVRTSTVAIGSALPAPAAAATATSGTLGARESERRAAQLMAQGQTAEASMVFDALVLSNPMYEPKSGDLTPESLSALRSSQRLLFPGIVQKYVERGKAALSSGDFDRALQYGSDATTISKRGVYDPQPQVVEQIEDLIGDATAAKNSADQVIYNQGDKGIVPPRPLSPQFPLRPPVEVPAHRVGTLEMIIDRDGAVEFVRLHTPLNRYHERMIVSAAKAWRYRPATKDGRPVKCRISVRINLPESGTDY